MGGRPAVPGPEVASDASPAPRLGFSLGGLA